MSKSRLGVVLARAASKVRPPISFSQGEASDQRSMIQCGTNTAIANSGETVPTMAQTATV